MKKVLVLLLLSISLGACDNVSAIENNVDPDVVVCTMFIDGNMTVSSYQPGTELPSEASYLCKLDGVFGIPENAAEYDAAHDHMVSEYCSAPTNPCK